MVKSSSSGAPYYCKKADLQDVVFDTVDRFREDGFIDEEVFRMPTVIYNVVQASKSGKFKRRLVYCLPFKCTIYEIILGSNILDFFVNNNNTSLVVGHTQKSIYDLMMKQGEFHKNTFDYKSYDQTIPKFVILWAFEIIKHVYDFKNDKEVKLFDMIVDYNLHGHIFHPTTGIIHRERGICSGSVFTNLIGSICNLIIMNYTFSSIELDYCNMYVCGDDNLLLTNTTSGIRNIPTMIKNKFDMDIELDYDGSILPGIFEASFLGSYWSRDGPMRSIKRMILSTCKQG